jgi:hypothetical protein
MPRFHQELSGSQKIQILARTKRSIEETRRVTHDDKIEGMEITALSIASDSCIGNMSDIIIRFCD